MNDNEKLTFLIEKWKIIWEHYKLQYDLLEKRVRFLWIIQGAMFIAWQYFLKEKNMSYLLSFLLAFIGIVVSYSWILISRRHFEIMFLIEMELRDVEEQFNKKCVEEKIDIELNKIILDKKCIGYAKPHKFSFSGEEFNQIKLKQFWELNLDSNKSCQSSFEKIVFPILRLLERYMTLPNHILFEKNEIRSIRVWIGLILPKFFLLIWIVLLIFTFLYMFKFVTV